MFEVFMFAKKALSLLQEDLFGFDPKSLYISTSLVFLVIKRVTTKESMIISEAHNLHPSSSMHRQVDQMKTQNPQ